MTVKAKLQQLVLQYLRGAQDDEANGSMFARPPDLSAEAFAIEIASRLEAAPRAWKFRIPVLRDSEEWLGTDVGGRRRLALRKEGTGTMLVSDVEAHTLLGARIRAEQLGLAWIGCAFSLDLVDLYFDDSQRFSPASVVIESAEWDLTGEYLDVVDRSVLRLPQISRSDLDAHVLKGGDQVRAVSRHTGLLRLVMCGESQECSHLQSAARLVAMAATTIDFGKSISLAFSVVEGLLLDGQESSVQRISEAVAHGLGRSVGNRRELRKAVKSMYESRSVFVHTGSVQERSTNRQDAIGLAAAVLSREIGLLPLTVDRSPA